MSSLNQRLYDRAIFNTELIYNYYFDRLLKITMSTFKWHNLPDTCNARYMEEMLLRNGFILFFKDSVLDKHFCLPCTIGGGFDVNHEPIMRMAYGSGNGYQYEADINNSVIIYNNVLKTNGLNEIEIYARDLSNLHTTINVNVHSHKTPLIIKCAESQVNTLKNLYMKYEGNVPVIFGDENLNLDGVQVLKTDSPFVSDKLYNLLILKWNEYLTYLGVDNVQTQKKERMVTDEVNIAMGSVNINRECRLRTRELACKQINEMFGLNISVEFVGDSVNDVTDFDSKEGARDESLYN